MPLRARTLVPALLAAMLAGCATPPPPAPHAYVVLLENADGSVGKVVYSGPQGVAQLDQPREAVALRGPAQTFVLDAAQLQRDAGAALAAQPVAPRTFELYFDVGNAQITKASEALLPEILQEVRSRAVPELAIIGHTDTVGSAEQNATLSLRRAEQVAELLKEARAAATHVEIASHGEHNLLISTPDETAEPRNRRVEVTVR
ncbi:OmpA family protein [Pseudorhodoferax sp. Leaf267]|uniref:OmpA family protein n=1 Tax=Pseudorhodoferax sp. Leaf267 TaxID=1736316 RepID=UPI0009EBB2DA|nr:OmpA family protein [Pseudorhodoferax sp. Leaf267]